MGKTYMTNFGIDFGLFNNRLNGSFDIYDKNTKGILISLPAPLEHGTSTVPNQNAGEVNNCGLEFDINWSDRIGNVGYSVGFNMAYVEIRSLEFQGDVHPQSAVYTRPRRDVLSTSSTS